MARTASRKKVLTSSSVPSDTAETLPGSLAGVDPWTQDPGEDVPDGMPGTGNGAGCRNINSSSLGSGDGCHFVVNVTVQFADRALPSMPPGGRSQPLVEVHVHVHQHGSGPALPVVAGAEAPTDDAAS